MHLKCLTAVLAALVAVGAWQAAAVPESGARQAGGPDAELLKHGGYLVSEVAHCGHCHTPQDAKGMPDGAMLLRGAALPVRPVKETAKWADKSPDITAKGLAGKWSEEQMVKFLTTGVNPEGHKPTPPMPVFHLNTRDARAVALYLKSLPGTKAGGDKGKTGKDSE